MLLVMDIGNTNTTIGVFEGEKLRATWRIKTDAERLADDYATALLALLGAEGIAPADVSGACICSVVPDVTPAFEQLCRRYFKVSPLVVGTGTRTGVKVMYDTPRDVGADRIVDVVAAIKLYGPPPLVIVDLGTATVFDAISAEGEYLGGAITPGIGISAEALFSRAAKLHQVELEMPKTVIGRNTNGSIQSGIVLGYVELVAGMVRRFRQELGEKTKVIATGGWARLIGGATGEVDYVDPDLTLTGLRLVHKMNEG